MKSALAVFDQQLFQLRTLCDGEVFTSPYIQIMDTFKHHPFFPRYFLRSSLGRLNYIHIKIKLFFLYIHIF